MHLKQASAACRSVSMIDSPKLPAHAFAGPFNVTQHHEAGKLLWFPKGIRCEDDKINDQNPRLLAHHTCHPAAAGSQMPALGLTQPLLSCSQLAGPWLLSLALVQTQA